MAGSTIDYCAVLVALTAACGSKERSGGEPLPDIRSQCEAVFDRYHTASTPLLAELAITETTAAARSRNAAGLTACERWSATERACMLALPPGALTWRACRVDPPFTFYAADTAHQRLLGGPLAKPESDRRVAELVGTWTHPSVGRGDAITWTISTGGRLDVHTVTTDTAGRQHARDQTYQLSFARDRQLALASGSSVQFMPAFVDGERLYVSWTTGAIAIPIPDPQSFALDLADRGRWLLWNQPSCTLFDPALGPAHTTCRWDGDRFSHRDDLDGAPHERAWTRRDDVLLHPGMELFTRQGR